MLKTVAISAISCLFLNISSFVNEQKSNQNDTWYQLLSDLSFSVPVSDDLCTISIKLFYIHSQLSFFCLCLHVLKKSIISDF